MVQTMAHAFVLACAIVGVSAGGGLHDATRVGIDAAAAVSMVVSTQEPEGVCIRNVSGRLSASLTASVSNAPRPHILLLMFDDMGFNDMGKFSSPEADTLGNAYQPFTPLFDEVSIARGSVRSDFLVRSPRSHHSHLTS
jgi:hypothetical protein